jgi:hypothetical protein
MSCEYNSYALTEDEQEAGLLSILCGNDYEDEDTYKDEDTFEDKYVYDRITEITDLIAGFSENKYVKEAVIKKVFLDFLKKDIQRYISQERIPEVFINIAVQKNALEIILKVFLKQECHFVLDANIVTRIKELSASIYENKGSLIVYNRVARIQKFIHIVIQEKYGKGSHLQLNKLKMRNLLSICRLHLEFNDIRYKSLSYLLEQEELKEEATCFDYISPVRPTLLPNQKYVPRWKYRNKHIVSPFSDYSSVKKKIAEIEQINIIQPIEEYKEKIIGLFK